VAAHLDYEENMDTFNYVLTISLKTHLLKYIKALEGLNKEDKGKEDSDGKYLFECDVNLNKIESRVTHEQYEDILDLISGFSEFQRKYQAKANELHFINYREKRAKEIADLLQKKKNKQNLGKKEQELLSTACRKYLVWVWKATSEELRKRKFIK
jgi:hypothetical protein